MYISIILKKYLVFNLKEYQFIFFEDIFSNPIKYKHNKNIAVIIIVKTYLFIT